MNHKNTTKIGLLIVCVLMLVTAVTAWRTNLFTRPPAANDGQPSESLPPQSELETSSEAEVVASQEISEPSESEQEPLEKKKLEGKLVALTFDDGPSYNTAELLAVLKEEDIKATFYVVGINVANNPDALRQIADEGHEIGNHTFNHARLTSLSDEDVKKEIEDCVDLVQDLLGVRIHSMRPPFGSYDDRVRQLVDMPIILWSVDPRDWEIRDADAVYTSVVNRVEDGDIILLHDPYFSTTEAVKHIIPELKSQGYTFVTVEELTNARLGDADPEPNVVYTSFPIQNQSLK